MAMIEGSLFIVEPSGVKLTSEEKYQLAELKPSGIMLRSRNFLFDASYDEWFLAYAKLIDDVRNAIGRESLIVSIDHEGGPIVRPPEPITRFPYPADWGGRLRQVVSAMSEELTSLGVNMVTSPVADVHSNPLNPVIHKRAFGTTPEDAARAAGKVFDGFTEAGLICCAKHFPGHGDTDVDSHVELPTLSLSPNALKERELIPFDSLIKQGIPMVMPGHLRIPSLDDRYPATLSDRIINGLLRCELGFNGVVISDGLGMGAILERMNEPGAPSTAVNAGLDLFLVVGDEVSIGDAVRWAKDLADSRTMGTLSAKSLDGALERTQNLLDSTTAFMPRMLDDSTVASHRALCASTTRPV